MRIYDRNLTGASASESGRALETQRSGWEEGAKPGATGADGVGDRVEFSSTLGRLSRVLSADGADRASHVQALAAQYQSGKYRSDSAATAGGMVAEALGVGSE
jgi:hypothetical protein